MKTFAAVLGIALAASAAVVSCYNPNIADGQLLCNPSGKACPDGFTCAKAGLNAGRCVKGSSSGGTGGVAGSAGMLAGMAGSVGGTSGAAGIPVGGTGGIMACVMPVAGCVPGAPGSACDPVCQSGCQCRERCSLIGMNVQCAPIPAGLPASWKKVNDTCAEGAAKADNCEPGLICLPEVNTACNNHCYKFCRTEDECGGKSHCSVDLQVMSGGALGQKVCDNPSEACNPTFGAGVCANAASRPQGTFGCYLMGNMYPNETVCDCAGSLREDQKCEYERECAPGLICADLADGKGALCRRVCPLNNQPAAQQICGAKKCGAFYGSTRFGTCN